MAAASSAAIAGTVAAVAMALAIFYHFNFGLMDYMEPLKDACGLNGPPKGKQPSFYKLNNAFLDGLHCLVTPFFIDCVASAAGRFWVLKTLELATPVMAVLALEEARSSAAGLVRFSFAVIAAAQLLGISVALPLLWLPCYLLLSAPAVKRAFLPAGKVPAIAAVQVASIALSLVLTYSSRLPRAVAEKIVVVFNVGLPLLSLLWTFAPGGARPGNARAAAMLRGAAALAFAVHALSVADMLVSHGGDAQIAWRALGAVAARKAAADAPANFMQFDFVGVFGSALIFLLFEGGFAAAARLLVLSPVLGPGAAFALAAAAREERLAVTAAAAKRD